MLGGTLGTKVLPDILVGLARGSKGPVGLYFVVRRVHHGSVGCYTEHGVVESVMIPWAGLKNVDK